MPEDKKQSFEDELISAFLTKSTEKARKQIADEGRNCPRKTPFH